jgi:CcmD family protein
MIYLAGGFFVVWAVVFLFVLSLVQRERALEREIAALRALLAEREGDDRE